MQEVKNSGVPLKFYVFGSLTVLALVAVSVIPATMVYRLRLFDAVGLPDYIAEMLRLVIISATPLAVLSTGAVRVFAVSDTNHAKALTLAAVLEIVSFVAEILAALVNGHDIVALVAQGVFLSVAIVSVAAALVQTISASGFYKLAIAHNEQVLTFDKEFNTLYLEQLKTPQIKDAMQAAIVEEVKARATQRAGRKLWDDSQLGLPQKTYAVRVEPVAPSNNGNGSHPNAPTPSA